MSRSRAVRSGFSAVFRRPMIFVAELAWRWTFGAAALLLLSYSILLFLSSTPVSDRDMFGLSGIIPGSARAALAHIFAGSGPTMVRLLLALTMGLGFLWWMASAFGRAVVLQELLAHPKRRASAALGILLQLNFLRTVLLILALLAYVGCFAFASRAALAGQTAGNQTTAAGADFTTFYLVFLPLAIVAGWLWSTFNWYLSVAPLIALRTGCGALDSIFGSATLVARQFAQFLWVGLVFGGLRMLLAGTLFFFAISVSGVLAQFSAGLALSAVFFLLLVFFAVADFLATARLAAYVRILEWDSEKPETETVQGNSEIVSLDGAAADPI